MQKGSGAASSSLTDILASLVAVFVLLFVAAQNNRGAGWSRLAMCSSSNSGRTGYRRSDSAAIDSIPNDPSTVLVILPDSVLFERGDSRMSAAGQNVVRIATPLLAGVICADSIRQTLDQVVVEGHTDNTIPFGMRPEAGRMFNLELSQRRSMNFVATSNGHAS